MQKGKFKSSNSKIYVLFLLLNFVFNATPIVAQTSSILQTKMDYQCSQMTTADILIELSQLAEVGIGFDNKTLDDQLRNYSFRHTSLSGILKAVLVVHGLDYRLEDNGIVLTKLKVNREFIISGFIEDKLSGEALIAATVYDKGSGRGAITNEFGFFSVKVNAGEVVLEASYLGYKRASVPVTVERNHSVRISLEASLSFEPIEVVDSNINKNSKLLPFSNQLQMNNKTLQTIPSLGGEPDLFSYIQQQPGVTSGANGLGGLHVRGGNVDQNLVMLDGVPIFNPSHALGLFSIFNSSIVNNATMHRSGFSARFGGNLSSVLDVRSKEGNIKNFAATLDLSTIATKAMVELPFGNEKGGFLLGMRRTHLDPLIQNLSTSSKFRNEKRGSANFNFYDINAKVNFKAGLNDRFYFSFYRGADSYNDLTIWDDEIIVSPISTQLFAEEDQYIDWSNTIGSLRWNHIYGDRLFSNVTTTWSRFNYQNFNSYISDLDVGEEVVFNDFYNNFYSNIVDFRVKVDFDYYLNDNHKLIWGGEFLIRNYEPGSLAGDSRSINDPDELNSIFEDFIFSEYFPTSEFSLYLEDEIKIRSNLKLHVGLRNSYLVGTDYNYNSLQPRLRINYQPTKRLALELGASRMTQFLHLVTSSDAGFPNDLWVPSTAAVLPQHAWEISTSFGYQFSDAFRLSTAWYYKSMQNLLAYGQEASLPTLMDIDPDFWEEQVEQGEGLSYGWESQLQITKKNSRLNINYTLAESNRSFNNINDGFTFPSRYDRRHVIQANYSYRFRKQWEYQAAWMYGSGQPVSLISVPNEFSPLSTPNALESELIGPVNGYLLPSYHRLDFSVKWFSANLKHTITFGAYNIYNLKHPIYAYQVASEVNSEDDGIRMQQGLGIIPTIGYHWKIK